MNVGITGTSGYLGGRILSYLKTKKYTVYSFNRKYNDGGGNFYFSLEKGMDKNILSMLDVLIHCAYDFSLTKWEDILKINVEGTNRLCDDAYNSGVKKIIFISTMSSHSSCKSNYGKAKQLIEKHIKKYNSIIIKPGLIYGKDAGGMIGAIQKAIATTPLVPLVGGNKVLYLIHVDDLCVIIEYLLTIDNNRSIEIIAANKDGKTFKKIIQQLIRAMGKKRLLISIPFHLVYVILLIFEKLKINIGFRSDSLVSLYNQNENPDFSFLVKSQLKPRNFIFSQAKNYND